MVTPSYTDNMFSCSEFTMNLSSLNLTPAQVELLDKGLTFIPVNNKIPLQKINECMQRNIRNLKLRDFFRDKEKHYDPTAFQNKFKNRSDWIPPTKGLTSFAIEAINNITKYTTELTKNNLCESNLGTCIKLRRIKANLTPSQTAALHQLRNNKNIIIKPADKGGAVVVMDVEKYRAEGLRQLTNPKYYQEIAAPLGQETAKDINAVIMQLYNKGIIDHKQYTYLRAEPAATPRPFYLLPKIHKARTKWPHPQQPEGRPIVSDCGSETYKICEFIDYFLQPLATLHPSYVKDTYDFLSKIRGQVIPENALLVTGDVTALYTNMQIDRSIAAVREIFAEYPDFRRPDEEIIKLLEIALTRNDFEFAGRLFLQICGTAMGKKFAPSLANIYLRNFDEKARQGHDGTPENYFRFLDDVFFTWSGTAQQLRNFENHLNTLIPGIKITLNIRHICIEFLDTLIYKQFHNNGSATLNTKVYFKPTDTHQLLHADSAHPKHTVKGILKSQLIRFKRICSTYKEYNQASSDLFQVLRLRGYNRSLYRELKYNIWHSNYSYNTDNTTKKITTLIKSGRSLITLIIYRSD